MFRPHQNIWGFVRTIGICLVLFALGNGTAVQAGEPVQDLEAFVRAGCPHCEAAKVFLNELRRERPALRIVIYGVADDSSAARQRLAMLASERGIANIGVPTILIGTELIVGFLSVETTGTEIRARLDLMVMIAVVTLSRRKLQERAVRWLKLVSGIVMAGLGGVLLMKPYWLI